MEISISFGFWILHCEIRVNQKIGLELVHVHTPIMMRFISRSICVRLKTVFPLFIMSLVSFPAKMTSP